MMGRKVTTTICLTMMLAINALSQGKIATWTDHLSYTNCIAVTSSDNYTFGLTSTSIIQVNNQTLETTKINKTNLLNDIDATCLISLGTDDSFMVGYANGNIDIYKNQKVTNLPDIKEKIISGSKKINRFRKIGNSVMAVTDFGIVVINVDKNEVTDTWYLGVDNGSVECYDITLHNGNYYVACGNGLYQADASNSFLSYYEAWQKISQGNDPYLSVQVFNNQLVTTSKKDIVYTTSALSGDVWTTISIVTDYKDLFINNNLHIVTTYAIHTYSQSLLHIATKDGYTTGDGQIMAPSFASLSISPNGENTWFADSKNGLVHKESSGIDKVYTPNGPTTNVVQNLAHNGNYLIAVPGVQTITYNNSAYPATVNFFDGQWTSIDGSNQNLLNGQIDLFNIKIDPKDPTKAYIASWANGVFVLKDKEIVARYNSDNTPLKTVIAGDPNYIRIGAAVPNTNGDLFISNSYVGAGMVVLSGENQFVYNYKTLESGWMGDMIMDNNGYFWTYTRTAKIKNGLFVFDTQNTVNNQNDDRYRGALNNIQDNDSRNVKEMPIIDQDGNIVTTEVYSIAKDKTGYIWVGTDKGPLVNYRPWAVFDDDQPVFNRIKIPLNDGDNSASYFLESEVITCITIDGANRKWLGTRSSGAFLVSEDGTETIYNFKTDNSPIISNNIFSIAIDPKTGIVYFGTDKGIVSFKGTATEGGQTYTNAYAYPNPVRPGYSGSITIKGLIANSNVKIATVSGALVYETTSLGGQVVWDGKNMWGQTVTSGVYIVYMVDENGLESAATKILIVR